MTHTISPFKNKKNYIFFYLIYAISIACSDFTEIDPPRTDLISSTVFSSDASAEAAVVNLYAKMSTRGFSNGSNLSFSFGSALSADDLITTNPYGYSKDLQQLNDNEITPTNYFIETYWSELYSTIYNSNAIIEGLTNSTTVTEYLKKQLEGETKFIRAFHYFYLVNLYGDVPLVLSTDYRVNKSVAKTASNEIYNQIISDLQTAKELLPEDYSQYNSLRIRAIKSTASALLSRVYLYNEDWKNAEIEASSVIENSLFKIEPDLTKVFNISSQEAIFQLWRNEDQLPQEVNTYSYGDGLLRAELINEFEADDKRLPLWTRTVESNSYPDKYKLTTPSEDYSTVLRLAEQYLIRAEARTKQSNLTDAADDINTIRGRAGLSNTTSDNQLNLLNEIMQERRLELFTEWGHRWLDLKRTKSAEIALKLLKGIDKWQSTDILYPIPETQIINDPAMADAQNPGY